MRIQTADNDTKSAVRQILQKFLAVDGRDGKFNQIYGEAYAEFGINEISSEELGYLFTSPDLNLRDQDRYFVLELPENKRFLPFVTLQSTDDWVHFRIYVLLAAFDNDSRIRGVAFRYETDEGEDGSGKHDFCHAQLCRKISRYGKEVTPFWMLESDPTVPLEAKNQVSLVLCMLTSIYGRQSVLEKFYGTDGKVWEEMKTIRALRPNP